MSNTKLAGIPESPIETPSTIGIFGKLWWAARNPPAEPGTSFEGKTVLVTGANTGLGFEAAVKYAAKGASKVILGVRSLEKGEAAKNEILQRTGASSESIVILTVDLGDFASVQSFIKALDKETEHLDVALLNAGLTNPTFVKSSAQWEMALQVNVLSTALMAVMLLPLLRRTAQATSRGTPHLTFVSSIAHAQVQPEWVQTSLLHTINDEAIFDSQKSYGLVKLLAMAAMQAVARAALTPAGEPQIIVNSCCPFLCRTELGRNWSLVTKMPMMAFQAVFARSAEEGARTLVSATTLGPESQGGFWHHDVLHPVGDLARDDELMRKSWLEVLEVISNVQPGVNECLDNRT